VRGGFLDVSQRDAGVEGGGDERALQHVRPDFLAGPARLARRASGSARPLRAVEREALFMASCHGICRLSGSDLTVLR